MKLLSLQKAAGYWDIDSKLLSVFGKTENELIQKRPAQVDNAVWVTIVALIWLHSFKKPEQEEWKFIAIKATSWSRSRKATEYQQQKHLVGKLSECIQAGKALLESEVKEENLGL
ncbi:von Willebrand factor A domain-containing protein 5A-like isoform X2 [Hoplias malabaricus]|uniref:von Willebrand factor A domain-containing protein 5A-like isoform X2 n=1 Tax=Hoplias malabaricus TaxID=27720 RepID=UPI003462FD54